MDWGEGGCGGVSQQLSGSWGGVCKVGGVPLSCAPPLSPQAWLDSHGGAALGPFVGGTWLRPKGRKEAQCCEAATGRPGSEGGGRGQRSKVKQVTPISTGRVVGSVLWGGPEEVAAAVGAAEAAAEQWGRMAAEERALRLER